MRQLPRIALFLAGVAGALPGIAPAQNPPTVKIATQSPLSTERARDGEGIKLGAQLAIEQLKAPLERMGLRVELLSFDDQARPDIGVANAKAIVADPEVLAVVGHLDAGVAIPASEIYKEATLAIVSPAGTGTLLTDRNLPSVSRVCGRDDVQGLVAADFAAGTLMVKTAYVLHDGTTAAQDVVDLFKSQAERRGVKLLGFEALRGPADVDPLVALSPAEVRPGPRRLCGGGLRRDRGGSPGDRERGTGRCPQPRGRGRRRPPDEAPGRHR
jgi:branched-chain amino acid transport system substrate-binding protein